MNVPVPKPEAIFEYFDGVKQVFADPWPIHREIFRRTLGRPNDLTRPIYLVKSDTEDLKTLTEGYEAMAVLEALVRDVFKMQPFDSSTGRGAQWPHCLAAWERFAVFMSEAKKKCVTSPTTDSTSVSPPTSDPATPTGSASA